MILCYNARKFYVKGMLTVSNNEAIIRTAEQPNSRTAEQPNSRTHNFSLKSWLKKYRITYLPLHFIKKSLTFILLRLYLLYCYIRRLLIGDVIFTRAPVNITIFSVIPSNWGDDLNKYFFEYVTGQRVVPIRNDLKDFIYKGRYIMIGSILGFYRLTDAIVYGSGLMTASTPLIGKPDKIISVRGPLTRQALLNNGINCPEHYGDPALLLSVFYTPSVSKKRYVSIIPNMGTFWNPCPVVDDLVSTHKCRLIDMTHYEKWTDIIDAIASSSFVLSESLHGLIAAETYNIPCVWVEFINHNTAHDWSFKFRDFYESIGKHNMTSIKLYEGYDFGELLKLKDDWRPGTIDYEKLLSLFPFPIKPELRRTIKFPLKH